MSTLGNSRKWTNHFIEECSTFNSTSPRYHRTSKYPSTYSTASMSRLPKRCSSHLYRSYADSLSKKYDFQTMEKSLSRLSRMKCKHAEGCPYALKKKGKENHWRTDEQQQKAPVTQVKIITPPVVNTIHTVHTIFVPTPTPIVHHVPLISQNIRVQPIRVLHRPLSAPKLTIHYVTPSPPSFTVLSSPTFFHQGFSIFR